MGRKVCVCGRLEDSGGKEGRGRVEGGREEGRELKSEGTRERGSVRACGRECEDRESEGASGQGEKEREVSRKGAR